MHATDFDRGGGTSRPSGSCTRAPATRHVVERCGAATAATDRTASVDRARAQGAVDGAPGHDQAPLGAVEIAGDRRIVGVAVAVGDRHDAHRRVLERRTQGAELGVSRSRRPSAEPGKHVAPVQLVRGPDEPTGTIARCSSGSTSVTRTRTWPTVSATGAAPPTTSRSPPRSPRSSTRSATRGDAAVRELTAQFDHARDRRAAGRPDRARSRRRRHAGRGAGRARGGRHPDPGVPRRPGARPAVDVRRRRRDGQRGDPARRPRRALRARAGGPRTRRPC